MKPSTFQPYKTPYFIGLSLIAISFMIYLITKGNHSNGDFFHNRFL